MMTDTEIKDKSVIAAMLGASQLLNKVATKVATLKNDQLSSVTIWIDLDKVATLLSSSIRTIQRQIKSGKYATRQVPGKGGKGGLKYEILLSSLPIEAQKIYWMENAGPVQPERADIQEWQKEIAQARHDVLKRYNEYVLNHKNINKVEAKRQFCNGYNKQALPDLYKITGKITYPTIERWNKALTDNNMDWFCLAPGWGKKRGKRNVDDEVKTILLQQYNSPNKPKISEAIRTTRQICEVRGLICNANDMTLRRLIEDHVRENADVTTFLREGQKSLNDKMLPYIERDRSRIEVGDIVVADGHMLDFDILDPGTGRPRRMALILCYDFKSNMPLGWEIMPTENTQTICAAYRNTIIGLGYIPRVFYLDNGKAFRAKFFTRSDFEATGFGGLFERLHTDVIFAWPYHGQSKTVERFFGSFGEVERKLPTYRGNSISNKPARLNRGEKVHRAIYAEMNPATPTIQEAVIIINNWFREYSERPITSGPLKGRRPIDVFNESLAKVRQQPDFNNRQISLEKLDYLMMETTAKSLTRNGIRLLGGYYFHDNLYQYEKGNRTQFRVKYNVQDLNSILVYVGSKFICEARRTVQIHPAAAQLGTPEDVEQLKYTLETKRGLQKRTIQRAKALIKGANLNYIEIKRLPASTPEDAKSLKPTRKIKMLADFNEPVKKEKKIYLFKTDKDYDNNLTEGENK
ncbi:MAG: Mu transposase C-terminal domain-containing protein [Candidatus Marinimicrobia bacterium]|nr:Mu transposase C-terminal domain-containing protein [Candidatus Neomarinimicrobiota bacterium]